MRRNFILEEFALKLCTMLTVVLACFISFFVFLTIQSERIALRSQGIADVKAILLVYPLGKLHDANADKEHCQTSQVFMTEKDNNVVAFSCAYSWKENSEYQIYIYGTKCHITDIVIHPSNVLRGDLDIEYGVPMQRINNDDMEIVKWLNVSATYPIRYLGKEFSPVTWIYYHKALDF